MHDVDDTVDTESGLGQTLVFSCSGLAVRDPGDSANSSFCRLTCFFPLKWSCSNFSLVQVMVHNSHQKCMDDAEAVNCVDSEEAESGLGESLVAASALGAVSESPSSLFTSSSSISTV